MPKKPSRQKQGPKKSLIQQQKDVESGGKLEAGEFDQSAAAPKESSAREFLKATHESPGSSGEDF